MAYCGRIRDCTRDGCSWRTNHKYAALQHRLCGEFFSINLNKKVLHKFSDGPSTPFQRKVSLYSVILLFILLVLLGGPFFESENWRLIWLGALLATGIHFFPYYFVHGKSMIFLGLACVINAAVGYLSPQTSLVTIAYIDAFIKLAFGLYLFFLSKPSKA